MQPDIDLLVVVGRIAADYADARSEHLAREGRAGKPAAGLRATVGRWLVSAGARIAGEPIRIERPSVAERPS